MLTFIPERSEKKKKHRHEYTSFDLQNVEITPFFGNKILIIFDRKTVDTRTRS